jgi:hypothetical protein
MIRVHNIEEYNELERSNYIASNSQAVKAVGQWTEDGF